MFLFLIFFNNFFDFLLSISAIITLEPASNKDLQISIPIPPAPPVTKDILLSSLNLFK